MKDIKTLFGDQFLTETLLEKLGINKTCLLQGDYYHLMHKVWPKSENFGPVVMAQVKNVLRRMLKCKTEEEWNQSYTNTVEVVKNNPDMVSLLDNIKSKPSYYAGYWLRGVEYNLYMNGDAPAEQNHASNVAYLGRTQPTWSIMQHTCGLVKRA